MVVVSVVDVLVVVVVAVVVVDVQLLHKMGQSNWKPSSEHTISLMTLEGAQYFWSTRP